MKKTVLFVCIALLTWMISVHSSQQRLMFLYEQLTQARDFKVRIAAANEIGKMADGSITPYLEKAFDQESSEAVRIAILDAMAHIPSTEPMLSMLYLYTYQILSIEEQNQITKTIWNRRNLFPTQEWALEALTSEFDRQRALSYWILSIKPDPIIENILIKGLEDESTVVLKRIFSSIINHPTEMTLDACKRKTSASLHTIRRHAQLCAQTIQYRLNQPSSKRYQSDQDIPALDYAITPDQTLAYFRSKVPVLQATQVQAKIQPLSKQAKNVSFQKTHKIASTVVQSDIQSDHSMNTIDVDVIRSFMQMKFPTIQGCYELELAKNPKLNGTVAVNIQIANNNHSIKIETSSTTLPNPKALSCIESRLSGLKFPSTGSAKVDATYRFHFSPPEKKTFIFTDGP